MALFPKSFVKLFSRQLIAAGVLIGLFIFVHFQTLGGAQKDIESKESAWLTERPKIGQLTDLRTAQGDLLGFKQTLPDDTGFPQLVSFISELAAARHLTIPTIAYQPQKTDAAGVAKIVVSFSLKGDYQEIRKFIFEIERSRHFLIIENMVLASSSKEGEKLQLQLQLAAYVRSTSTGGKEAKRAAKEEF